MSFLDPRPLSLDPECVPQLEARAIAREVAVDVATTLKALADPLLIETLGEFIPQQRQRDRFTIMR